MKVEKGKVPKTDKGSKGPKNTGKGAGTAAADATPKSSVQRKRKATDNSKSMGGSSNMSKKHRAT